MLYLRGVESSAFSAVTVFNGTFRLIVLNDAHAETRTTNSVAHVLAHCVLAHAPAPLRGAAYSRVAARSSRSRPHTG